MTKRKKLKLAAVAPGCALFLVAVVLAAVFLAPQFTERHFKVKQEVIEPIAAASELPQMFGGAAPVSAVSLSPAVTGWGCSRIQESDVYELAWVSGQRSTPPSLVYPGEVASDLELTVQMLLQEGYNAIRISIGCPSWSSLGLGADPNWMWNETAFARSLAICKYYGVWVIYMYGGSDFDSYQYTAQWMSLWQSIITNYGASYDKIIWEPNNEPAPSWSDGSHKVQGQQAIDAMTQIYQGWITMCRGLGDNHWIVVGLSGFCYPLPKIDWWANVTDPAGKVFLSDHHYYYYSDSANWTVAAAQAQADADFSLDAQAVAVYGRPYLSTEMGAATAGAAPDEVYVNGYGDYSPVSLAYVQELVKDYKSAGMNYILFPCSDVYVPRLYGEMNVWGQLIS